MFADLTPVSACTFADLTPDALRAVLRRLQLREVAALSCVSLPLFALCGEEPLWRALCEAWGAAHARSPFDADAARRALRLRSFCSLRRVLHGWRGDPLGVWRTDMPAMDGDGPDPYGDHVLVSLRDGRLSATKLGFEANMYFHTSGDWRRQVYEIGGDEQPVELPPRAGSRTATVQVETRAMNEYVTSIGCDPGNPDVLWCSVDPEPDDPSPYLFRPGTAAGLAIQMRRLTGLPIGWSALPAASENRCRLQPGLYTAQYGDHGQEVILLRRLAAGTPPEQPLPDGLSLDVPRWEALKICGDVNVPANRFTFVAPDAAPDAQVMLDVLADQRPIVSFASGNPVLVDLQARGLAAVHTAWGQINEVPGVWAPKWLTQCTLLEYRPDREVSALPAGEPRLPVAFSMLWSDGDRDFAHITDFTPFAPELYAHVGVLEWAQLPPADEGVH